MDSNFSSMSIASFGPSTLEDAKVTIPFYKDKRPTNDISDIDGARAQSRYERFANKYKEESNEPVNIRAKSTIRERNVRNNSLYIDDIEGTRNLIQDKIITTNRHLNPLNPQYELPSFTSAPPPQTKFLRDTLNHSDIEGTSSKALYKPYTRDIMNMSDIPGTSSSFKSRPL